MAFSLERGRKIYHIEQRHARFDVLDAGFKHPLAFAGCVVAGVFFQIAFFAGFLNGLDNVRTLFLQTVQLLFKGLETFFGNGDTAHVEIS